MQRLECNDINDLHKAILKIADIMTWIQHSAILFCGEIIARSVNINKWSKGILGVRCKTSKTLKVI